MNYFPAALLGLIEGLTEFIPVSSTGHLILFVDLLQFQGPPGRVFEVVIQLGAILAVLVLYWRKFLDVILHIGQSESQHFVRNILLAFLPAMVVGALAHGIIKAALFNPIVVACSLIIGGIAILLIEKHKPEPVITSTEAMSMRTAFTIGLVQCLAMIPGVSRSGATIMGALMLKVERKTAAEFSFFLAVPTMLAAASYDLYKARDALDLGGMGQIAVGFFAAFIVALLVVRFVVGFVQRHGFQPFAWYRIAVGVLILALAA